jgi:isoleucyl-tRNA synthetase
VRTGYAAYDFQGVFRALFDFCTVDLSAVYFDIRKDALYCDGPTLRRNAARTVLDLLFHRLTTWLAPILVFTMEEVWLERFPGEDSSVHLVDMPQTPADWRDEALAEKWAAVRRVRRVVTAALEVQRQDKVIGASLEAAPVVHVADPDVLKALKSVDFADICITSALALTGDPAPQEAFRLARGRRRGRGVRKGRRREVPAVLEDPPRRGHPPPSGRLRALRRRAGLTGAPGRPGRSGSLPFDRIERSDA